jgi:hypothetical protein
MISYYGYTISPNQIETGEGFLICRNVPIARTGEQDYIGTELGLNTTGVVKVNRPAEEVFSDAALASFEGKPVTNDHPPVMLDPESVGSYEKGHIQNVRKGTGEWEGYVIADLHIHDGELIRAIKEGKRQVSCGYECDYTENEDGTYTQSNIRGNHVAVVELGRAGSKAAIMDSNITKPKKAERKTTMSKQSTFMKLFGMAANGKNDEELTQLAMDAADALEETAEVSEEVSDKAKDEDPIAELTARVDSISDALGKLMEKLDPKEEEKVEEKVEEKTELDEAIEKLAPEEEKGGEEAVVVPAEEMDACGKDGCKAVSDSVAAHILKAMRPAVAEITDEKVRKSVSDALINAVSVKTDDIAKVMDAQASYQSKPATAGLDEVQNAYANMNPHTKKEDK